MSDSTQQQTPNGFLRTYRRALQQTRASGQATEHSYRPMLQRLIEDLGGVGAEAINEPTHGDYGAPDFIALRGALPIGHSECKDIGQNLDTAEESDQLQRYPAALPNAPERRVPARALSGRMRAEATDER